MSLLSTQNLLWLAIFWATFAKNGLLFVPTSVHTASPPFTELPTFLVLARSWKQHTTTKRLPLSFEIQIFAEPHESWNLLSQFFNIRNFFSRQSSLRNTGSSIVVDWKREMLNWNFLAWIFDPFDPVVKPLNAWMFTKKVWRNFFQFHRIIVFGWTLDRTGISRRRRNAKRSGISVTRFGEISPIWPKFGTSLAIFWRLIE